MTFWYLIPRCTILEMLYLFLLKNKTFHISYHTLFVSDCQSFYVLHILQNIARSSPCFSDFLFNLYNILDLVFISLQKMGKIKIKKQCPRMQGHSTIQHNDF